MADSVQAQARGAAPRMAEAGGMESRLVSSLRDAVLVAFLAGVLGFFFIGLRRDIAPGGLDITARWGVWLTSILVVFVGRLALNLLFFKTARPAGVGLLGSRLTGLAVPGLGKWVMSALFFFALILPFIVTTFFAARERQFIDLAILIMTYVMLGWGLNVVVGLAGLLDLGYVAFYAVGAYSFALISTHFDAIGFWGALPMAGALAALWGIILGFPVLR